MELEERAADPLAGGLQQGYQCGMTWGAALAGGARAYQLWGSGPQAEMAAILAAQRTVEAFRAQNHHVDCLEITEINLASPTARMVARFLVKSSVTGSCFGMAGRYAPAAFREINAALSAKPAEAPSGPSSCAALLAHKMGASDLHTVMAAGLAGGIGLSGGGCGALGAALWITAMNLIQKGDGQVGFRMPGAQEVIDRFLKSSDYEFECLAITGRTFKDAAEHAAFVRDGGCAQIIQALSSS